MSKFNNKIQYERTSSYEGGKNYKKNPVEDLINFMLSSYLEDRYYESAEEQMLRFLGLLEEVKDKLSYEWIAKLSFFARNEVGMRSIAELTAAWLNGKKFDNKRAYFRNFFRRPDDVGETFAAIDSLDGKRSHALVRGAGDYLSTLGEYQLTKYKMLGREYNMYDLINLCHPKSAAVDKFQRGEIKSADTWETRISGSENEEEKEQNWRELVEGRKLGYLALLRNLRNILNCDFADNSWIDMYLVPQLVNATAIKKSLVFPYQIYTAYKFLDEKPMSIMAALDEAFRIAIGNVPILNGSSLLVLDVSGSMDSSCSDNSKITCKEIGAVYGACIYLSNKNSDFIKFGDRAKRCEYRRTMNVFNMIEKMQDNDNCGYGTNIISVWDMLDRHYDRIFLISDMQVMEGPAWNYWLRSCVNPVDAMNRYFDVFGQTNVYSFDVCNYNSQVANPRSGNLTMLTSLSSQVFKMLEYIEKGGNLIQMIQDYTYQSCSLPFEKACIFCGYAPFFID